MHYQIYKSEEEELWEQKVNKYMKGKPLNIFSHQEHANQDYIEIPSHSSRTVSIKETN